MSAGQQKSKSRGMAAGSSLRTGRRLQSELRDFSDTDSTESSSSSSDESSSEEDSEIGNQSKSRFDANSNSKNRSSPIKQKSKQKSNKIAKHESKKNSKDALSELQNILRKISNVTSKQSEEEQQAVPDSTEEIKDTTNLSSKDFIQALVKAVGEKQVEEKHVVEPGSRIEFKRLDQVWNRKQHKWELKPSADVDPQHGEWDQYVFNVRREFDSEGKFFTTFVDIKSKPLRECLRKVIGDFPAINLYADTPIILPDQLFWYLEEFRDLKRALKEQVKSINDKKSKKAAKKKAQHLGLLIKYLDEDYAETKKVVYPMLEAGVITFKYLWVLFKPNTIGFCPTYGDDTVPRAFKIKGSELESTPLEGTWRMVRGRFVGYDGNAFGTSKINEKIMKFEGTRKICSLPCYPLKYHKDPATVSSQLIERGKTFIALQGGHYKTYNGMAYRKKDGKILKLDVRGRVMVDTATFRRIEPNYCFSKVIKDLDDNDMGSYDDETDNSSDGFGQWTPSSEDSQGQKQFKLIKTKDDQCKIVEVDLSDEINNTHIGVEDRPDKPQIFSEEQLLIASPVVLGFSFNDKLWVEFDVAKISEVQWNEGAFDSLILPDSQKSIIKALVSSHVFHPSRSIDDVIAGKGKGLVAVLHGSPGVGKTLTLEAISDFLRRPLYMVSAGELGTDARLVEMELQKILDIAHSWGAILLLDEADVFLEARSTHEIHRNALVSVFLRLLEYFQGILFLTTNRVQVFDEAFVSRIHLSLQYGELSTKAKKTVWKSFIDRVKLAEGMEVETFADSDYENLARRKINGRQIKNIVRAAQALAVHEDTALSMKHIKTVLDVAQTFERDLKGGTGYEDAMRGYT